MIPICLSKQLKYDRSYSYKNLCLSRDSLTHTIKSLPKYCPHLGYPLDNLQIKNNQVTCPYHGWSFCSHYTEELGIFEYGGIVWEENSNLKEDFPVDFLSKVKTENWRSFSIKTNWRHLLSNLCDYSHFHVVHKSLGGKGLSKPLYTPKNANSIQITWSSKYKRPLQSEVVLFLESRGMVSTVPFLDTHLSNISFVVEVSESESILLTSFWFEKELYNSNPWIRFWTNRVVDLLVYEDKKILEKIKPQKPNLYKEQNPLILKIYG